MCGSRCLLATKETKRKNAGKETVDDTSRLYGKLKRNILLVETFADKDQEIDAGLTEEELRDGPVIPTQNKGLCSLCDRAVWMYHIPGAARGREKKEGKIVGKGGKGEGERAEEEEGKDGGREKKAVKDGGEDFEGFERGGKEGNGKAGGSSGVEVESSENIKNGKVSTIPSSVAASRAASPSSPPSSPPSRHVLNVTCVAIKWCKGCKNFREWETFGNKGRATKCERCRVRQRTQYKTSRGKGCEE